jgi:hypothetical protein
MHTCILSKRKAGWTVLMALETLLSPTAGIKAQNGEAGRPAAEAPRFEIASIKAVAEDSVTQCGDLPCMNLPPRVVDPQRFRAMTVLNGPIGLIEWAYGVKSFQVTGLLNGSAIRNLNLRQTPTWR